MTSAANAIEEAFEEDASSEEQQYLTFMLSRETYGIAILNIREIIEFGKITQVPMVPDFIRGVINLRGSVVPVIDLSRRFGKPQSETTRKSCIVVIELADGEGTQEIGVLVDSVNEVIEIHQREIEPAPSFGTRIRTDFIKGMGKVNGEFVVILEASNVLSMEEMALLADISANQSAGGVPGRDGEAREREGARR